MKHASVVVVLAWAASMGAGAAQAPATERPDQPAFRAGVDVVSLNVTVTDGRDRYVAGLDRSAFEVYEDGIRQDVTFFASRPQPIALSLLLDSSASMEQTMPTLQTAAVNFVRRLTPGDLAQVIDFNTRVIVRQEFTADQAALEAAIHELTVGGATSLYTAIYIALRSLEGIQARSDDDVRRQGLIVFSDGEDTSSLHDFEDVFDLAKRSETTIFTILLRGSDVQAAGFREAEFVMRQLASETGGRSFSPVRIGDLADAYAQIAEELSSQYTLGYVSSNSRHDGEWRRLTVQVRHGGASVRTRRGYYASKGP